MRSASIGRGTKKSGIDWIGDVPNHWDVLPFYSFVDEVDCKNVGLKERNLLSLSYGRLVRKNMDKREGLTPGSFAGYNIIEPNDIVFRLTDLQNDQTSLRSARSTERGIITSAYVTVRPRSGPRFFEYLMRSYDTSKVFYGIGGGIRQSMKFADLKRLPVMVPPAGEMQLIADFLDRETTRIDALIDRKTRFIALLREKRQALITHAVTKGLDDDVPMKDSGVEWLGEVPAHWAVRPLKFMAKLGNGSTPSKDHSAYWQHGDFPWLTSTCVNQQSVLAAEQFVTPVALHECHLPVIDPPAVLVGITGQGKTRGMATTLGIRATINQHLAFIKADPACLIDDYLRWFLDAAYAWLRFESEGVGSTKGAITIEQIAELKVPLPELSLQTQIVRYLQRSAFRIDTLITQTERSIALLREKRTALITAAVTGKIDLRAHKQGVAA